MREDKPAEAAEHFKKCLSIAPNSLHYAAVVACYYHSVAQSHQGNSASAEKAFATAAQLAALHLAEPGGDQPVDSWHDWLVTQIARREAQEALKGEKPEESAEGAVAP